MKSGLLNGRCKVGMNGSLPASLLNVTAGFRAKLNTVFLQWGIMNMDGAEGCAFLSKTHLLQLQGSICPRSRDESG